MASLQTYAEDHFSASGLDLRIPKDALAPVPIYIIIQDKPDTLPSVRSYAKNILGQIDAKIDDKPMLDNNGNLICADRSYDYLIVLDKTGRLIDIKLKAEQVLDPRGLREITLDYVLRAAQSVSPFPPFPEAERLGQRLVGIPSKLAIQCKKGLVRSNHH